MVTGWLLCKVCFVLLGFVTFFQYPIRSGERAESEPRLVAGEKSSHAMQPDVGPSLPILDPNELRAL